MKSKPSAAIVALLWVLVVAVSAYLMPYVLAKFSKQAGGPQGAIVDPWIAALLLAVLVLVAIAATFRRGWRHQSERIQR